MERFPSTLANQTRVPITGLLLRMKFPQRLGNLFDSTFIPGSSTLRRYVPRIVSGFFESVSLNVSEIREPVLGNFDEGIPGPFAASLALSGNLTRPRDGRC